MNLFKRLQRFVYGGFTKNMKVTPVTVIEMVGARLYDSRIKMLTHRYALATTTLRSVNFGHVVSTSQRWVIHTTAELVNGEVFAITQNYNTPVLSVALDRATARIAFEMRLNDIFLKATA